MKKLLQLRTCQDDNIVHLQNTRKSFIFVYILISYLKTLLFNLAQCFAQDAYLFVLCTLGFYSDARIFNPGDSFDTSDIHLSIIIFILFCRIASEHRIESEMTIERLFGV